VQTRQISAIATQDFSGGWPFPRNFDVEIALDQTDARLRPGMGASVRVTVDRVPNAIIIPAQASFQKSGRTVAYVLNGAKFGERTIEVGRRSGDRLLIAKGLQSGEKVAMQDPTLKE
jgi:HlyD family secretion protein